MSIFSFLVPRHSSVHPSFPRPGFSMRILHMGLTDINSGYLGCEVSGLCLFGEECLEEE